MTYDYIIKQPKRKGEINLNMIVKNNPHLINALDRSINHSLMRNYSEIPFQSL